MTKPFIRAQTEQALDGNALQTENAVYSRLNALRVHGPRDEIGRYTGEMVALAAARSARLSVAQLRGFLRYFAAEAHEIPRFDALGFYLEHPDEGLRADAARWFAARPEGRSLLVATLLHESEAVRLAAAEALAPTCVPSLAGDLREVLAMETSPRVIAVLRAAIENCTPPPMRPAPRPRPPANLPQLAPLPAAAPGSARERLEALAASAEGERVTAYLLHVGREADGFVPRAGSLSRTGGRPPGMDPGDYPRARDGVVMDHVLTLDLAELPELAARYPAARALALFVPEPAEGQRNEEADLVEIEPARAASLPNEGHGEHPIAALPLSLPLDAFADQEPEAIAELWSAVFRADGHVLGCARWIHGLKGPPELAPTFVCQLNDEDRWANANFGQGSLYVYTDGAVYQCL